MEMVSIALEVAGTEVLNYQKTWLSLSLSLFGVLEPAGLSDGSFRRMFPSEARIFYRTPSLSK